eukprot:TRINITY_DN6323_c0_g2_i13.p1 TRINITY_DN6323_c0_g2~~TRINITY_DN6323_c0_g2_i13.p1  ORF type:complete len:106 (+),score=0.09 TRINITY_DN6323_c0_g2_i13:67-384(+)
MCIRDRYMGNTDKASSSRRMQVSIIPIRNLLNGFCDHILIFLMLLYALIAADQLYMSDARSDYLYLVTFFNLIWFDFGLLEMILIKLCKKLNSPGWFLWMNGFHN